MQSGTRARVVRIGAAAALVAGAIGWWASAGGASDKTIRTAGTEDVHINSKIFSNLRFSPGQTTVRSGDAITLEHSDQTEEPHTLTIVDANELPSDTEDIFQCGAPGTLCDEVFTT